MDDPRVTVLTAAGDMGEVELERLLAPHLDGASHLVLDLGAVEFVNSAGLGVLVKAGMRLDGHGRSLGLVRPRRTVDRTLRLLGLDAKLPIYRTVEAATVALSARAAPRGSASA